MAETPYTPGGSYTPPVPKKPTATPPVVPTPGWSWPPNGTPAANVPTPTVPNYQAPGSYLSGVNGGLMGNLPAPAYGNGGYPTTTATAPAGGGGGGDTYNGWPIVDRSPGGNILVLENGVPTAYDPWGNKIPHLYAGAAGGDPNGGGGGGGGGGGAPAVPTTPAVPTPPTGVPPTFYAPTTGSPYLQLGNLWGYMNDPQRAQLNDLLIKAGFKPTGALTTFGNSDYLRPAQFDQQDLMALTDNENIRQWLRFYLGDLGYGISYGLPAGYQPGSGLPTPPPSPQA